MVCQPPLGFLQNSDKRLTLNWWKIKSMQCLLCLKLSLKYVWAILCWKHCFELDWFSGFVTQVCLVRFILCLTVCWRWMGSLPHFFSSLPFEWQVLQNCFYCQPNGKIVIRYSVCCFQNCLKSVLDFIFVCFVFAFFLLNCAKILRFKGLSQPIRMWLHWVKLTGPP